MLLKKIRKVLNVLRGINVVDIVALKKAGLNIGDNCKIQDGVIFDYNHIQHIFIGNGVTIAPQAYILAHDASTYAQLGYARIAKVVLADNVFIGARTIIMPGVTIGENSIIAAGSVVVGTVPSNVVYGGNPARLICSLEEYNKKCNLQFQNSPKFSEKYTRRNKVSIQKRSILNAEMNEQMKSGIGFIK